MERGTGSPSLTVCGGERHGCCYRVLIIDDDFFLRETLRNFFLADSGCMSAVAIADAPAAPAAIPDASDVFLLACDGTFRRTLVLVEQCMRASAAARVVILARSVSPLAARRLIQSGVAGIVSRQAPGPDLISAVRAVVRGGNWRTCHLLRANMPGEFWRYVTMPLTLRQEAVLAALLEGCPNKETAYRLGVSENSVKCTVRQLFAKARVHTRIELMRLFMEPLAEKLPTRSRPTAVASIARAAGSW